MALNISPMPCMEHDGDTDSTGAGAGAHIAIAALIICGTIYSL